MTKAKMKERSLLFLIFSMLLGKNLNIDLRNPQLKYFNDETVNLEMNFMLKKLFRLSKVFFSEKTKRFLDKRLANANILDEKMGLDCNYLHIGLILLYFYLKSDIKKEMNVNDISASKIPEIFEKENLKISNCSLEKAERLFLAIYPDKKGFIEFLKISKRFPFNF